MQWAPMQTGRPVTMARRGLVSAAHYLAAEAGIWALEQGGNAVDAAIAAGAVLCVVQPHMAGLGGDALFMVWQPGQAQPICLNGCGAAAAGATARLLRERGYEAVPRQGALSALTVPGAVAAWGDVHARWGALPWAQLFEPAIHYAEDGFPVSGQLAAWLAEGRALLERSDAARAVFVPGGRTPGEGEVLVQKGLARSLESLAEDGPEALYSGDLAAAIVADLEARGGLVSLEDLAGHHSDWAAPLGTSYRGHALYEFPPNSLGAAAALAMNLLEGWDVAAMAEQGVPYYHHMAEAAKIVAADVGERLADPGFVRAPLAQLLAGGYAGERRRQVRPDRAQALAEYASGLPAQEPFCPQSEPIGATACVAAVDSGGFAVSLVESLQAAFGSGVVAGDTGVLLHSSGAGFSLESAAANRLQPGKRPLVALMPAMVGEGGQPRLVFGTTGGRAQPQLQASLLTRLLDLGYNVQQAIEAPRWRYDPAADGGLGLLSLEARVPDSVLRGLRELGHDVRVADDWSRGMGEVQGVVVDRERGHLQGGADPRGDGQAIGR